jgi:hypothetical protein
MLGALGSVSWYEIGRCEICWALVQREDGEKHQAWHRKVDGWIDSEQERRLEEYDHG